ncbi:EAL and HDOD domain-containing protein [Legionella dresdenensis]|uniref:EAL and HDOD domain-containing protein n=1 Tax=Legionella dresdenensis TaxID=450200 RepID=A0ABV8CCV7_9GAMM
MKTLLARQRIFDKNFNLYGYELLYRNNLGSNFQFNGNDALSNDIATSRVLANLFTDLDLEAVVGRYRAFINFPRNLLISKVPKLLPKDKVIIEILESVKVDSNLIQCIKDFKKAGYQIALDDFIYRDDLKALVDAADIIKLDVLALSNEVIEQQLGFLKSFKGKLLAEKVENYEKFQFCVEKGFHLFQGFFLHRPHDVHGEMLLENRTNLLNLLDKFNNPKSTIDDIADSIRYMPRMSYKILRIANSALLYRGRKYDSVVEAIIHLGLFEIRNWISILLISGFDDLSIELLERCLIRAKMCEILSYRIKPKHSHQAYTVGLFSSLSDIFSQPLEILLARIALSEEINVALLERKGWLGELLQAVIYYEQAQFDQLMIPELELDDYSDAYMEAINHTNGLMDLMMSND